MHGRERGELQLKRPEARAAAELLVARQELNRQAIEHARLRDELAHEGSRWRLLVQGSVAIVGALDRATMLQNLVGVLVPGLADWCALDLVDGGVITRSACGHADPAHKTLAAALVHYPPDPALASAVTRVIASRKPEMRFAEPPAVSRHAQHLRLLGALGATAYLAVPAVARDEVLAVLTMVRTSPGAAYEPKETSLVVELAGRLALSMDHASLCESARQAVRDRTELLATVSRELKNPLTAIRMSASVLGRSQDQWLGRRVGAIERASRRMERLVQELTEITSVEKSG